MRNRDIIVIGGSSGATAPLKAILGALRPDLPAAVFIVLHIPARSIGILATVAAASTRLPVFAAEQRAQEAEARAAEAETRAREAETAVPGNAGFPMWWGGYTTWGPGPPVWPTQPIVRPTPPARPSRPSRPPRP